MMAVGPASRFDAHHISTQVTSNTGNRMHRPALARLYRPRRFSEIVGQEHVSSTLRSGVERDRVAHAYLFCGPRGVGKTTAARVLAMALNCPNREDGEPCGRCESCERIWSGRTSLDVVEIDAASNRGVDDARELRERAMYSPSEESRYKVYIIDEAHMLTREAWNAFLKILEEPPPRVIFVLATTEPGRILQAAAPILSRCQRFDFHRISMDRIIGRLHQVLESEKVEAEEAALVSITRKADGALRDALSALDQVLAFSGEQVTAADVRQVLGLVDEDVYFELLDILAEHRAPDVFGFVERLVAGGYDLEEFHRGLGESLRLLLRARLEGEEALVFVAPELADRYLQLARRFETGDLLRMLTALAELNTDGRFQKSEQQRLMIEVLLLRFAMLDRTVQLEEVLQAAAGTSGARGQEDLDETREVGRSETGDRPSPRSGKAEAPGRSETRARPDGTAQDRQAGPPGASGSGKGREAWQEMISDGKILRAGHGIALRAAEIGEVGPEGELPVVVVEHTPGAEVLEDRVTRRRIEEALSRRLGRPIRLSVTTRPKGSGGVNRVGGPRQSLERMVRSDPELGEAVERLDLELLE